MTYYRHSREHSEAARRAPSEMPRQLPIVEMNGKRYFFDERLRQIRNVNNPHDYRNLSKNEADALHYGVPLEEALEDD